MRNAFHLLLLLLLTILPSADLMAVGKPNPEEGKSLNVGEVILGHVGDSHEWHIMTLPSGKHISIPLPVILYSQQTGFHIFLSSKFIHGHERYKNFEYVISGENKGKIVEYDTEGNLLKIRPYDFSIKKNVVGLFIGLLVTFFVVRKSLKIAENRRGMPPKGLLSAIEPLVLFVRDDIARASISHHPDKFVPFLLSLFFMILVTNITGLIPIPPLGANVTGNLSVTLGLALFSFLTINLNANKHYWKHIYNTPGGPWVMTFPIPIMPLVEFIGVILKPLVLAIRLFANILGGHIVTLAFFSLIFIFGKMSAIAAGLAAPFSIMFVLFIWTLEILVAFIQAFVFTLLTAIFIGAAVSEHH